MTIKMMADDGDDESFIGHLSGGCKPYVCIGKFRKF
jgi:hypothetical protein